MIARQGPYGSIGRMPSPIRSRFATMCRDVRMTLDISQRELATAVGVSRAHIAAIEIGRANPSLDLVGRIGLALGLELDLVARPPLVLGATRQRDLVHARCSGYVDRRLRGLGWETRREVAVMRGRALGWIDILAYHPLTGTSVIIEIKTRLDDLGEIERQLGWYESASIATARREGWRPRRTTSWLLVLASDEVDAFVQGNRDLLAHAFPLRAIELQSVLAGGRPIDIGPDRIGVPTMPRGLAMIDPSSRRHHWLLRTRVDGRRSPAPYRDYRDAAQRLSRPPARWNPAALPST